MNIFKNFLRTVAVLSLALPFVASAQNWVPPAGPPTGNNVPAPVNVGNNYQSKTGGLGIGGNLNVLGRFTLQNAGGTSPQAGYVLTAVNGTGLANWAPPQGGSGALPACGADGQLLKWNADEAGWECTIYAVAFNGPDPTFEILDGSTFRINSGATGVVSDGADLTIRPTGLLDVMSSPGNNNFRVGGAPGLNKILADSGTGQGFVQWKTAQELGLAGTNLPSGNDFEMLYWDPNTSSWAPSGALLNTGASLRTTSPFNYDFTHPTLGDANTGQLIISSSNDGLLATIQGFNFVSPALGNDPNAFRFDIGDPAQTGLADPGDFTSMSRLNSEMPIFTNGIFVKDGPGQDPKQGNFIAANGSVFIRDLPLYSGSSEGLDEVCIDRDGENNIPGDDDDGELVKCKPDDAASLFVADPTGTISPPVPASSGSLGSAYFFEVPDDINFINVFLASAGGGGGAGAPGQPSGAGGGAGGAGGGGGGSGALGYYEAVPVNPGEIYCVVTGLGGQGGQGEGRYFDTYPNDQLREPGQAGGSSYVSTDTVGCSFTQLLNDADGNPIITTGGQGGQAGNYGTTDIGNNTVIGPSGGFGGQGGAGNMIIGQQGLGGTGTTPGINDGGAGGAGGGPFPTSGGFGAYTGSFISYDVNNDGIPGIDEIRALPGRGQNAIPGDPIAFTYPSGGGGGGGSLRITNSGGWNYRVDLDGNGTINGPEQATAYATSPSQATPQAFQGTSYEDHYCFTMLSGRTGCSAEGGRGGDGWALITY